MILVHVTFCSLYPVQARTLSAATLARGLFFAKISKSVDIIFHEMAISLFFEKTLSSLYDMSVLAKKARRLALSGVLESLASKARETWQEEGDPGGKVVVFDEEKTTRRYMTQTD